LVALVLLQAFVIKIKRVKMKSRGLGDTVEKITKATGIKTVVDFVSKGLNIPCACDARRDLLNKTVPYKN